jgi:hypothetical protein
MAERIAHRHTLAAEYREKAAQAADPYERTLYKGVAENYETQARQLELTASRVQGIHFAAERTRVAREMGSPKKA